MKQKVKMIKTLDGVDEDKIYPATFHEGEEYMIGSVLLGCFVELGGVELAADVPSARTRETKVIAPEETKPDAPLSTKSFDEMDFNELKTEAKVKGVKVFGLSEAKLRDALKA